MSSVHPQPPAKDPPTPHGTPLRGRSRPPLVPQHSVVRKTLTNASKLFPQESCTTVAVGGDTYTIGKTNQQLTSSQSNVRSRFTIKKGFLLSKAVGWQITLRKQTQPLKSSLVRRQIGKIEYSIGSTKEPFPGVTMLAIRDSICHKHCLEVLRRFFSNRI